jgi:hypothetical protein
MYVSGQYTVAAIATTLGVSRASIYRHLSGDRSRRLVPRRPDRMPECLTFVPCHPRYFTRPFAASPCTASILLREIAGKGAVM